MKTENHMCEHSGCASFATAGLVICVPATGHEIGDHAPIKVVIGLKLCDVHLALADPQEFFEADSRLKDSIRKAAKGRCPPDFSRAFSSGLEFSSETWKDYLKRTNKT